MSETTIPYTCNDALHLQKAHDDDAAYDLRAAEDVYLGPGDRALVKTGVRVAIPEGHAGLVLPRSGLALKEGITVLNAPGLIDPGYRGELGVILYRTPSFEDILHISEGTKPTWQSFDQLKIKHGDRVAQLLVIRTADVRFAYVTAPSFERELGTERGKGGFGSTGR